MAIVQALLLAVALAACATPGTPEALVAPSPERLERELQGLTWPQFRAVLEGIPKLRGEVDARGPLGWRIVEANYASYPWRRSIGKLDEAQRQRLGELIAEVRRQP